MRLKRGKTGDAMGRPSWRSLFLGDASASFFCETEQTGHDVWKMFPHPGLRFALSASPYGRRRARSDRSAGNVRETGEPKKQTRPRPKITYCSRKMVLTLGSTVVPSHIELTSFVLG